MASYKLNVLHWHLVDNEGWRIEIKQYPKLIEVGAWREEIRNGKFYDKDTTWTPEGEPYRYGGYYTQKQIKEVIEYAASRQITVIPEIELPGHSGAALAAYPELSCNASPQTVPYSRTHSSLAYSAQWNFNYCAGKEVSFEFLENVLDEVIALFPSEYIHIGGDEVDMSYWEACPHCQKRMADEHLDSEHELQAYFVQRIEKYLSAHGRKMIGWDEILEGGVTSSATVMSWRGEKGGIEAAKKGNNVIMSSNNPLYLNIAQTDSPNDPFAPTWSMNTLERVYAFNPVPDALTAEQKIKIIGTQASIWTEFISSVEHLEFMLLPRLPAFSESAWSGEKKKDFEDFIVRLNSWHYLNWKFSGTRFHPKHFERSVY
ncbi:hexosaminidase [Algoriphagus ratkowskyi]|nr:family 20 glycosylhydrolase [Algoriphagus ratkowskyi]PZX52112.1 hexosaminidase [Algoriphagus ratkowskyi]